MKSMSGGNLAVIMAAINAAKLFKGIHGKFQIMWYWNDLDSNFMDFFLERQGNRGANSVPRVYLGCRNYMTPEVEFWKADEFRLEEFQTHIPMSEVEVHPSFSRGKYFHGLSAFRCGKTPDAALKKGQYLYENKGLEICCSSRPVGPIGVRCSGEVLAVSNIDLWSERSGCGERVIPIEMGRHEGLIYSPSEVCKMWDHDEVILKEEKVHSIWIKEWVDESYREVARKLAVKFNVPVYKVEGDTSAWDDFEFPTELEEIFKMEERDASIKWYEEDEYADYHLL